MAERPNNVVVDLMDLRTRVTTVEGSQTVQLRSELRIGQPEMEDPLGMVVARRAFIHLELDGYEIQQGNRLGEPVRAGTVEETKKVSENVQQASASANAGLSLSSEGKAGASIGARGGGSVESKVKTTTSAKTKVEKSYVKALGGDRWEITPGEAAYLDGTYVTDSAPLCHLQRGKGANRASVQVSGYVLKKDLDFVPDKKLGLLSPNKSKILGAFLAKRIGETSGGALERLVISTQEIEDA